VSLTDIKKGFVSACEDAGIEDFTFHDLRHTYASRLADKGVPQATIKELLGQRTIKMSERYTHAVVDTMQWAVEQLCHKGERARPIFPPQSEGNSVSQESEPVAA
jgi:integrase